MAIRAVRLCKSFGSPPTHVLTDVSFTIEDGDFVSIIGKSGSGKSTLLYILSSLDFSTSGHVEIAGKIVSRMALQELHHFRNEYMGFVFQFHYLLPELTALENILMPSLKFKKIENSKAYALELLNRFGLGDKLHRLPHQLSGGEQQRVAIARSLVMHPRYLFADEPTGNLDSANGKLVMQILQEVNQTQKTTVVLVTHDPEFAALAHRQIHLADGLVV